MSDPKTAWLQRLLDVLENRCRPYAGALISYAHRKSWADGSILDLASARWLFVDTPQAPRPAQEYRELLLGEEWVGLSEAWALIKEIVDQERDGRHRLGFGRFSVAEGDRHLAGRHRIAVPHWPMWLFSMRASDSSSSGLHYGPIVMTGLPAYTSMAAAIEEYVFRQQATHHSVSFYNEIALVLPDTRARLTSLRWDAGGLQGAVESNVDVGDLELQLAFDMPGIPASHAIVNPRPSSGLILPQASIPEDAQAIRMHLVYKPTAELLHFETIGRYATEIDEASLLAIIASGEGETVEFKPFIEGTGEKLNEVIETVVALANSRGGRVFVGVDNSGSPQGRQQLTRCLKGPEEKCIEAERELLLRALRDFIKPVPRHSIELHEIHGEPVFIIAVDAGDEGPYSTHENDIRIRKGSTNRRPDPRTEMLSLFRGGRIDPWRNDTKG